MVVRISSSNRCSPNEHGASRRAFSLLELVVALVVFGLIITGIFPLIIMQSRGVKRLENRSPASQTWHLVPSSDGWVRKLGGEATVSFTDPGPPVPPAPFLLPVDNSDSGYSETGTGWSLHSDSSAVGGSYRRHAAANGNSTPETAEWNQSGLTAGWYDVRLTWVASPSRATDATYSVYDGANFVGTFSVNQQIAPAGDVYDNRTWESLAAVFIQGSTIRVELTTEANGQVVADAVRLVPIRNLISVQSFEHGLSTEILTARVLVDVQVP